MKVTHDEWSLFSGEVVNAAKLTPSEDALAWATGITTGTVTTSVLLVLGPVVGYYTGRLVHRKAVVKSVKNKLGEEGDLRYVLRKWNDGVFERKGFQAWLELPLDPGQLHKEYLIDETIESPKAQKKAAKKAARRFRIIIVPSGEAFSTVAELSSPHETPPPVIPHLVEASATEDRPRRDSTVHEPPPYSPGDSSEKDAHRSHQPEPSSSDRNDSAELYDADSGSVKYVRPSRTSGH